MENFRKNIAYRLSLVAFLFILSACLVYGINFLCNPLSGGDYGYPRSQIISTISHMIEYCIPIFIVLLILSIGLRLIAVIPEQSFLRFSHWKDFYFLLFIFGVCYFFTESIRTKITSWLLFLDPKLLPPVTMRYGIPTPTLPGSVVDSTLYAREYVAGQILEYMIFTSLVIAFFITISMLISEIKRLKNEKVSTLEENKVL